MDGGCERFRVRLTEHALRWLETQRPRGANDRRRENSLVIVDALPVQIAGLHVAMGTALASNSEASTGRRLTIVAATRRVHAAPRPEMRLAIPSALRARGD